MKIISKCLKHSSRLLETALSKLITNGKQKMYLSFSYIEFFFQINKIYTNLHFFCFKMCVKKQKICVKRNDLTKKINWLRGFSYNIPVISRIDCPCITNLSFQCGHNYCALNKYACTAFNASTHLLSTDLKFCA
jgi:hypothetical protein